MATMWMGVELPNGFDISKVTFNPTNIKAMQEFVYKCKLPLGLLVDVELVNVPDRIISAIYLGIFIALFSVHTYMGYKWKSWITLNFIGLGCMLEVVAYGCRTSLSITPDNQGTLVA
jgi:hypothetical protein